MTDGFDTSIEQGRYFRNGMSADEQPQHFGLFFRECLVARIATCIQGIELELMEQFLDCCSYIFVARSDLSNRVENIILR
ncbi:hypothetical protein D3C81_789920 [compost metagenome]